MTSCERRVVEVSAWGWERTHTENRTTRSRRSFLVIAYSRQGSQIGVARDRLRVGQGRSRCSRISSIFMPFRNSLDRFLGPI